MNRSVAPSRAVISMNLLIELENSVFINILDISVLFGLWFSPNQAPSGESAPQNNQNLSLRVRSQFFAAIFQSSLYAAHRTPVPKETTQWETGKRRRVLATTMKKDKNPFSASCFIWIPWLGLFWWANPQYEFCSSSGLRISFGYWFGTSANPQFTNN